MKKVLKTILMGAVAFSLAMGVGCVTGENSSQCPKQEKEWRKQQSGKRKLKG